MKLSIKRCLDVTFGLVISQGAIEIDLPFVGIWIVSDRFYKEFLAISNDISKDEKEITERYIG